MPLIGLNDTFSNRNFTTRLPLRISVLILRANRIQNCTRSNFIRTSRSQIYTQPSHGRTTSNSNDTYSKKSTPNHLSATHLSQLPAPAVAGITPDRVTSEPVAARITPKRVLSEPVAIRTTPNQVELAPHPIRMSHPSLKTAPPPHQLKLNHSYKNLHQQQPDPPIFFNQPLYSNL